MTCSLSYMVRIDTLRHIDRVFLDGRHYSFRRPVRFLIRSAVKAGMSSAKAQKMAANCAMSRTVVDWEVLATINHKGAASP